MPDVYPIPGLPLFNISKEFLLHLFAVGDLRFFLGSGSSCWGSWEHLRICTLPGRWCMWKYTHSSEPGLAWSLFAVAVSLGLYSFSVFWIFCYNTLWKVEKYSSASVVVYIGDRQTETKVPGNTGYKFSMLVIFWGDPVSGKAPQKIDTWPLIITIENLTTTQHLVFKTVSHCLVKSEAKLGRIKQQPQIVELQCVLDGTRVRWDMEGKPWMLLWLPSPMHTQSQESPGDLWPCDVCWQTRRVVLPLRYTAWREWSVAEF